MLWFLILGGLGSRGVFIKSYTHFTPFVLNAMYGALVINIVNYVSSWLILSININIVYIGWRLAHWLAD